MPGESPKEETVYMYQGIDLRGEVTISGPILDDLMRQVGNIILILNHRSAVRNRVDLFTRDERQNLINAHGAMYQHMSERAPQIPVYSAPRIGPAIAGTIGDGQPLQWRWCACHQSGIMVCDDCRRNNCRTCLGVDR